VITDYRILHCKNCEKSDLRSVVHCLWNQLPASLRQPRTDLSNSDSPTLMNGTSSIGSVDSYHSHHHPSLFHSRLQIFLAGEQARARTLRTVAFGAVSDVLKVCIVAVLYPATYYYIWVMVGHARTLVNNSLVINCGTCTLCQTSYLLKHITTVQFLRFTNVMLFTLCFGVRVP